MICGSYTAVCHFEYIMANGTLIRTGLFMCREQLLFMRSEDYRSFKAEVMN